MSSFWQAPGNGKGFDSFLGNNSKMNNRTIGVLSYIKEIDDIKSFESDSSKYRKFNTWVINSLVDLEILVLQKDCILIHEDIKNHIEMLYRNVNYEDTPILAT